MRLITIIWTRYSRILVINDIFEVNGGSRKEDLNIWIFYKTPLFLWIHGIIVWCNSLGHKIYDGTTYIKGHYLNYNTMNNKCHVYTHSKIQVFVPVETIFFPYIAILDMTKSNIKIFNEVILELQVRIAL